MSAPHFILEIVEGPQRGRSFPLREGDLIVGRSPRCAVALQDAKVDPTHCGLRVRHDQVIIAPGGSISQTFVNDELLTKARLLRVHDRVRVGAYTLAMRMQHTEGERHLFAGDQVGPFSIVAELGAGAVGRVYEARDANGRTVALKLLRRRDSWTEREEEHRRALFRREAAVLAAINHPNVVRSFGSGEHQGVPWLAMELLDGLTLREVLIGGRLPMRQIERIMFQLCAGVGAVHAAGIIHRDLKPANVMLVGADERVCLADFGLAQLQGAPRLDELDETPEQGEIRVGRQIGTPAYMAPEQTMGAECDLSSDVWALGAVLYELAAGRRPFPGNDVRQVLTAVVRDCPEPLPDDVAPHLRGVVYRCLQKRAERRFHTAVQMVEALHDRTIVQYLPVGPDGPAPLAFASCPCCGNAVTHPIRCTRCGESIFKYSDGQVLCVPNPAGGRPGLACGVCAGAVQHHMHECPTCHTVYRELPPDGLTRSAADLTHGRPLIVDAYEQGMALLQKCPYCEAVRRNSRTWCDQCGFAFKGYVTQRIHLELAYGGWELHCGNCDAQYERPDETHCPRCGLSFANGQMPDGTRFDDELLPSLRKQLDASAR